MWRRINHRRLSEVEKTTCVFCSKRYRSYTLLEMHMNKHTKERPFQCSECDATFGFYSALFVHRDSIHRGVIYTCQLCPMTFTAPSNLSTHKRVHFRKLQKVRANKTSRSAAMMMNKITKSIFLEKGKKEKEHAPNPKDTADDLRLSPSLKKPEKMTMIKAPVVRKRIVDSSKKAKSRVIAQKKVIGDKKAVRRARPSRRITSSKKDAVFQVKSEIVKDPTPDDDDKPCGLLLRNLLLGECVDKEADTKLMVVDPDNPPIAKEPELVEDPIPDEPGEDNPQQSHSTNVTEESPLDNHDKIRSTSSSPSMCHLPPDDPRCIQVARLYAIAGVNDNPTNLFFCVNGEVSMPVLSPQLLRILASAEPEPPVSESEHGPPADDRENLEGDEETNDHACGQCGKQFPYRSKLVAHMVVHSGMKPFACIVCAKRFTRKVNMENHVKAVHKNRRRVPKAKKVKQEP